MADSLWLEAVLVVILVLANGVFAGSEIAIVSSRRGRLEQRAASRVRGARAALDLQSNPDRFLSTVQVGITVISTLAAAFGGDRFAEPLAGFITATFPSISGYAGGIALTLVVIIISYLSLILGELVPKRIALQNPETIACSVAPLMQWLSRLASAIVSFLSASTQLVLRALGRANVEPAVVTEEDVLALVREGREGGALEPAEQELITSVFTFTDRTVRSVMTPRTRVVAIAVETPPDEALDIVMDSGYSRIPVFEGTFDRIIGILFVKDLMRALRSAGSFDLRPLLRHPLYVPESQRALLAFQRLRQTRNAVAIVLDEYGQTSGLITMEDILEELVGEIADEYDEQVEEMIVQREDGSYLVDGLVPFDDLRGMLRIDEHNELEFDRGFETAAGFLLTLFGRIPNVGDTVRWANWSFEVVDMDGRRIDKILIRQETPQDDALEAL